MADHKKKTTIIPDPKQKFLLDLDSLLSHVMGCYTTDTLLEQDAFQHCIKLYREYYYPAVFANGGRLSWRLENNFVSHAAAMFILKFFLKKNLIEPVKANLSLEDVVHDFPRLAWRGSATNLISQLKELDKKGYFVFPMSGDDFKRMANIAFNVKASDAVIKKGGANPTRTPGIPTYNPETDNSPRLKLK